MSVLYNDVQMDQLTARKKYIYCSIAIKIAMHEYHHLINRQACGLF